MTWKLTRPDLMGALVILAIMFAVFGWLSPGAALRVTFWPGVVVTAGLLIFVWHLGHELPSREDWLPVYLVAILVQLLHFAEEYVTGFPADFARLYGGESIPTPTFVLFNMSAYAAFLGATLVAWTWRRGALLGPSLFFVAYGVVGNALAHITWAILARGYFPGLITALLHALVGPILLRRLLGPSLPRVLAVYAAMAATMLPLLVLFADAR